MHDQPIVATIIGPDVHIRGEVILGAAARIDGRVEGRIESSGELFISQSGVCSCDIEGVYVVVEGIVQGDVIAREKLELRATGQITGEISAASVSIAEGATFVGQCRIGPPTAAPMKAEAAPQPAAQAPVVSHAPAPKPASRLSAPAAAPVHTNGHAAAPSTPAVTTRPVRSSAVPAAATAMTSEERRQQELLRDPEMMRLLQS